MDEPCPNPASAQDVCEKNLNFDQTNEDTAEGAEKAMESSDKEGVGHMFGSQSESDQRNVDKIVTKYNILNHYICQTPKSSEYMSNQRDKEIAIYMAYLKAKLRFPLHQFFIWFIKNFQIQPKQLIQNWWRCPMAFIQVSYKNKVIIKANMLKTLTKMSQHMKNLGFVYLPYKQKDKEPKVSNINRYWKGRWFFIRPEHPKVDWAFLTVWHKISLINT